VSREQIAVPISENTHISEARRGGVRLAQQVGFDQTAEGNLAIVVTELARNVLLHGAGGDIILQAAEEGDGAAVDVIAVDKGRGIGDMSLALQDGYSSAGTPGTGFGAVQRLTSKCAIYSASGQGTAILARVHSAGKREHNWPDIGSVCVPIVGESLSGDAWEYHDEFARRSVIVADGLGHGTAASDAAQEALAAFRANAHRHPEEIIAAAHGRLQKTRGAAVAVVEIDFERQLVRYSGVGNIAAAIVGPGRIRSMISHNGIVGHQVSRIQEFTFPWEGDAMLVMYSDGINSRCSLSHYPGLAAKPAALIAGVLYRDFKRGRDDATVVIAKSRSAV
jgi:anti-sigma regulatory factor (Ser/Thr protein kinase)